jgi:hypothetical protein
MDCQAAEVMDDEASVEAPKISQDKSDKPSNGIKPVMPTDIEQMRGGKSSKTKNQKQFYKMMTSQWKKTFQHMLKTHKNICIGLTN